MISVQKRGKVYQYKIEIAKVENKRKFINKSGFKTKSEAYAAGILAYEEYKNGGIGTKSSMSYADYLDYWMKEYFEVNYKYSTSKRYSETFKVLKEKLGKYRLYSLTPYILNQTLVKLSQKVTTKEALRNYQKVIKSSLRDAAYYFGFLKVNPAAELTIPKMLSFEVKKTT